MKPVLTTAAGNLENQDRGIVLYEDTRIILCVADGAGGRSGGAEAAAMAMVFLRNHAYQLIDSESCSRVLQAMDEAIACDKAAGETTCALAVVTNDLVFGASVGDSGIWLITNSGLVDLTARQQGKPFLGSGSAYAATFAHPRESGQTLLLATDGLLKYASSERIVATCSRETPETVGAKLVELVRYNSGALPDDVTVIEGQL